MTPGTDHARCRSNFQLHLICGCIVYMRFLNELLIDGVYRRRSGQFGDQCSMLTKHVMYVSQFVFVLNKNVLMWVMEHAGVAK